MDWMTIIGYAIKYGPVIKGVIDEAASNDDIVTKIKKEMPIFAPILEQEGGRFFPKVAPALRIAAVAMTSFDPNVTKFIQRGLNQLVDPSPNLSVDGLYGPATRAAVISFQEKTLGLKADGWAGQLTQAAIDAGLKMLQGIKPATLIAAPQQ